MSGGIPFGLRVVERHEKRVEQSEWADDVAVAEQRRIGGVSARRRRVHEVVARVAPAPLRVDARAAEQLAAHVILLAARVLPVRRNRTRHSSTCACTKQCAVLIIL